MIKRIIDFRPPAIAWLLLVVAAALHFLTPMDRLHLFSNVAAAIVIGLSGFAVMMWAWWLFRINNVAIQPMAQTRQLITLEIYRLSRNPMYLGMILMVLAVALFFGTAPFYLATAAYFIIINHFFCPYEESKLTDEFGETYLAYKTRVRRWL